MGRLAWCSVVLWGIWAIAHAGEGEPGFNCEKAANAAEKLICDEPSLATADRRLNEVYSRLRTALPQGDRNQVRADQLTWMRARERACDWGEANRNLAIACLLRYYRHRQQTLEWQLNPEQAPSPQRPLRIDRMTPSGEGVDVVSQIVFQFNQPVVPVGDMRRDPNEIPVVITPDASAFDCRWRWLNSSALSCDLASRVHLKPATQYQFRFEPIRAESGAWMSEPFIGSFSATRPEARGAGVSIWLDARHPVLRVNFNMPVTAASVVKAIRIHAESSLDYVLLPSDFQDWNGLPRRLAGAAGETALTLLDEEGTGASGSTWLLAPVQPIVPGAQGYVVVEGPGLQHPAGDLASDAEPRELARIDAYPHFQFIALQCYSYERERGRLSPEILQKGGGPACAPDGRVSLTFSSPVSEAQLAEHVLLQKVGTAEIIRFEVPGGSMGADELIRGAPRQFSMRSARPLEPASQYQLVVGEALQDGFGRSLAEPLEGSFATTHRAPRLEYRQGNLVLESGRTTDAFVQVRNVGAFDIAGHRKTHDNQSSRFRERIEPPGIDDQRYGMPLNLRHLLGDGYTWMQACLRWRRASLPYPFEVPRGNVTFHHRDPCFSVQVTPFHVHAKTGPLNTLIWVTELESGEPVEGARVEATLRGDDEPLTSITDAQGRAFFNSMPTSVWVHKGDAAAQLELNYQHVLPNHGYGGQQAPRHHVWGFTPQGVYQAGDEVAVKGYYRFREAEQWVPPRDNYLVVVVTNPRGEQIHRVARAELNRFGTFSLAFKLPEDAGSGTYYVQASRPYRDSRGRLDHQGVGQVAQFVVSNFNPVEIDVSSEILGHTFRPGDTVRYRATASFMSGGAYANARARITGRLILQPTVRGVQGMDGFQFPSVLEEQRTIRLFERDVVLDENGMFESEVPLHTQTATQGDVVVDVSVMDERGQQIAAHSRASFSGRDAFPGIKVPWNGFRQGQEGIVEVIVIDGQGRPLADRKVAVKVERARVSRTRIKAADESYKEQDHVAWEAVAECALSSASTARECRFTPDQSGEVRITATITDYGARAIPHHVATLVRGDGEVLWTARGDNTLQISPRQDSVEVGDTAAYLVRNPFPGSRALITIEREGVIDSFVRTFDSPVEQIEFPVTAEHVPGYFLSVVIAAPRAGDVPPSGSVDLGQPTYASGYVRTRVPTQVHRLDLTVTPEQESYAPGDKARVRVALNKDSTVKPEDVEVAVLVLDEGVLALNRWGMAYYDLHRQWHRFYGLGVANYNLLTRLADKVAYDGKGTTPGGDGADGSDGPALSFREDFRYLVHWEPALSLDENGEAEFTFDLPDNLTRWRVIAVVSDAGQRAGLADKTFVTQNPTEIRAAFPNQVTEGDEFVARFTVTNRDSRTRELNIDWHMSGPVKDRLEAPVTLLTLAPYQRQIVDRPLVAETAGVIEFVISAGDDSHSDGLRHRLDVLPVRNQEVLASYGSVDGDEAIETLLPPHNLNPRLSRAEAMVMPTVLGVGGGAIQYLTQYQHRSWENVLSRGFGHAIAAVFEPWMQEAPTAQERQQAVAPGMPGTGGGPVFGQASRFQLSDGGMTFWPHGSTRRSDPFLSIYTLLVFDQLRQLGYVPPEDVEKKVRIYLRGLLRQDSGFGDAFSERARLSLRGQILHVLAASGDASRDDLLRLARQRGDMDMTTLSAYLQAQVLLEVDQSEIGETLDLILAGSRQDAGTVYFEGAAESYNLGSTMKIQCEVLSALVAAERSAPGQHALDAIPYRLMRFITQGRDGKDHWLNTQENAYCLMAIRSYAEVYESAPLDAIIQVSYGNESLGSVALTRRSQPASTFEIAGDRLVPGVAEPVHYRRDGQGRFYHATRMHLTRTGSAPQNIDAGISVSRSYAVLRQGKWEAMGDDAVLERGDVVRVQLEVVTEVPRNFVVADDPVPGAFEPVSTELATGQGFGGAEVGVNILQDPANYPAHRLGPYWLGFVYHQMDHEAVRFYADYLPQGRYLLSYTMQVVAAGDFHAHPVKASEMYNPETFGLGQYRRVRVQE